MQCTTFGWFTMHLQIQLRIILILPLEALGKVMQQQFGLLESDRSTTGIEAIAIPVVNPKYLSLFFKIVPDTYHSLTGLILNP